MSDVTELASGPNTASGDSITAQLIQPDRQNQRDHDRLASCGKQALDFGGRSKLQLFGSGPQTHGRSAEADSKAAPGAAAVSRLGRNEPSGQRFVTQ